MTERGRGEQVSRPPRRFSVISSRVFEDVEVTQRAEQRQAAGCNVSQRYNIV